MSTNLETISVLLKEFTLFPKLPLEMRLKIWRHSLPGPRIVTIKYNIDNTCTSTAKIPIALHATSESRKEAKRFYKLSLGNKPGSDNLWDTDPKIWIDNRRDLVYIHFDIFKSRTCMIINLVDMLQRISGLTESKYLGVEAHFLWYFGSMPGMKLSSQCPSIY